MSFFVVFEKDFSAGKQGIVTIVTMFQLMAVLRNHSNSNNNSRAYNSTRETLDQQTVEVALSCPAWLRCCGWCQGDVGLGLVVPKCEFNEIAVSE